MDQHPDRSPNPLPQEQPQVQLCRGTDHPGRGQTANQVGEVRISWRSLSGVSHLVSGWLHPQQPPDLYSCQPILQMPDPSWHSPCWHHLQQTTRASYVALWSPMSYIYGPQIMSFAAGHGWQTVNTSWSTVGLCSRLLPMGFMIRAPVLLHALLAQPPTDHHPSPTTTRAF